MFWSQHRKMTLEKKVLESAQEVDPGEESSPAAPAGTGTHELSITSATL